MIILEIIFDVFIFRLFGYFFLRLIILQECQRIIEWMVWMIVSHGHPSFSLSRQKVVPFLKVSLFVNHSTKNKKQHPTDKQPLLKCDLNCPMQMMNQLLNSNIRHKDSMILTNWYSRAKMISKLIESKFNWLCSE